MATVDDSEIGFPILLGHALESPRREPFGMERAVEDLESQVGDARSPGTDTHTQQILSGQWPFSARACYSVRIDPVTEPTSPIIKLVASST